MIRALTMALLLPAAALAGGGAPGDGLESADPALRRAALAGLEARAESGDVEARRRLGFLYLEDRVIARDVAVALHYLRPAAEAGDVDAHRALGLLTWRGEGVARDPVAACRHLERAARAGDGAAARQLADWLRQLGERAEVVEAWLRRGAVAGHAPARYQLALEILGRPGGLEDPRQTAEARGLLQAAARQGHPGAQYELAVCLGRGIGGQADRTAARTWMARAALAGHPAARMVTGEVGAPGAAD